MPKAVKMVLMNISLKLLNFSLTIFAIYINCAIIEVGCNRNDGKVLILVFFMHHLWCHWRYF